MVPNKIPPSYIFSFLVIMSAPKCIFSTSILETPYFGSIEVDGEFACSATVIDDVFVLASNSCISGHDVSSLAVRVGTDKLGHRGQVYNVHKLHYYFDNGVLPSPPDVDVVLVEVSVPFWFNPRVTWLNPNNDGIKELQNGIVSMWAEPKTRGSPLVSASVFVLPSANCSEIYTGIRNISRGEFCLWPLDSTSQPCQASLGAPMYYNEQLYGVVTYTPGCSRPNLPVIVQGVSTLTTFMIFTFCDLAKILG
uniref:Peptidase S1 domain-containing protein n=1 Tax=Homalodisca liturata TaxID=320908 RepID=A0A1B6JLT4_9HEMI